MRQAIEEGFILDVLKNYTTYKTYYRLVKAIEDDPQVDKKKAAKTLARFMSLHPHNIAQKTEVMVEHFRRNVRHRMQGQAKAMVVTSSRLHAVKYKQAFDRYIAAQGYDDIKTLVAFSGTVVDEVGSKYTERRSRGVAVRINNWARFVLRCRYLCGSGLPGPGGRGMIGRSPNTALCIRSWYPPQAV